MNKETRQVLPDAHILWSLFSLLHQCCCREQILQQWLPYVSVMRIETRHEQMKIITADLCLDSVRIVNTLRQRQNTRHFTDNIFQCIFLNENAWISIDISLKFVPKGPINNSPALVWIMAWCRPGDKPLSEPMVVSLLTHIYITQPQRVNLIIQTREHSFSMFIVWYRDCWSWSVCQCPVQWPW